MSNQKGDYCAGCPHLEEACLLRGRWSKQATLTIVLASPGADSIINQDPLTDREEAIVTQLLEVVGKKLGRRVIYNVVYLTGAESRTAPLKEAITSCSKYMFHKLIDARRQFEALVPEGAGRNHVIVPFGKAAVMALLPKVGNLKEVRGRRIETEFGGYTWQIMPTFSRSQLHMKPGYARVMAHDLAKAYRLSLARGIEERQDVKSLTDDYVIPRTIEEVREVCSELLASIESGEVKTISVDIETNTLDPHRTDGHTSVISFAWAPGQATAILLDHPRSYYDAEEAWKAVTPILESNVKTVFHNGKFDLQFLRNRRGIAVPDLWWDTILAEHFLDEDKSGVYGLKEIIGLYAPKYVGYEDELKANFVEQSIAAHRKPDSDEDDVPNFARPEELMTFFADIDYAPVCLQPEDWTKPDLKGVRKDLFDTEVRYLLCHRSKDSKGKTSSRGRIRRICLKHGIAPPASSKNQTFGMTDNGYDDIPVDMLLWYAAVDADVTRIVCQGQRGLAAHRQKILGKTTPNVTLQADMEHVMQSLYVPGTTSLSNMSFKGTKVDLVRLATYEKEIGDLADEALRVVRELTCQPKFNPNSSDDMTHLVQKVLEVDPIAYVFTDTGALSVTDSWLTTQQDECKDKFTQEVIYYIRIYKKAAKTVSSFLSKFRTLAQYDGRIHTSFNLNGTSTGRLSSSSPNLQNVPLWMCRFDPHPEFTRVSSPGWNIKALFIPSAPKRVYWQLDISAAEVRVLCAYANDERLIKALIAGQDIHSFIASHIFDHTYDEFIEGKDTDPDLKLKRTATKRVLFGLIYGAGPYKLAEQIYNGLSTDENEKREQIAFAQSVMDMVFERFPKIREYINNTTAEVQALNQVRTFFGRRRRFDLREASWKEERKSERQAVNFKIQSSSSDIVLSQLCASEQAMHTIGGEVLLTVHDSLAGEIDIDRVPEMRAFFDHYIVEEVKRKFPWLPVPFVYDLEVGPTYGEMMDYGILEKGEAATSERVLKKARPLMEATGLTFFSGAS